MIDSFIYSVSTYREPSFPGPIRSADHTGMDQDRWGLWSPGLSSHGGDRQGHKQKIEPEGAKDYVRMKKEPMANLNWMEREGLSETVSFKLRSVQQEGTSCM